VTTLYRCHQTRSLAGKTSFLALIMDDVTMVTM